MDLGLCLFCVRHVLGYKGKDVIQGRVAAAHAPGIAVSNLGTDISVFCLNETNIPFLDSRRSIWYYWIL